MSADLGQSIVVTCPICGKLVEIPLTLHSVELFVKQLIVVMERIATPHEHDFGPDTDGLRPIERFVKHGALDDRGRST